MTTEIGISHSSSTKFYRNGGITEIPEFYLRYCGETKAHKLSDRVQELQNEVNCMNDSNVFQDAESVRSGNSHVTSRTCHSHLIRYLKGF